MLVMDVSNKSSPEEFDQVYYDCTCSKLAILFQEFYNKIIFRKLLSVSSLYFLTKILVLART